MNVRQLRLVIFAKAAESMGHRIDELKRDQDHDNTATIEAIRSEWLVEED